jgi:hypothetical protein
MSLHRSGVLKVVNLTPIRICASLRATQDSTYVMSTKCQEHLDTEMLEVLSEFDKFLNQEQRLHQTQEESLSTMDCGVCLFYNTVTAAQKLDVEIHGEPSTLPELHFLKAFDWYDSENLLRSNPEVLGRGLGTLGHCGSQNFKTTRRSAHIRFLYQR